MKSIDFKRRPEQPVVGWFLLAAGLVSLAAALVQAQQWAAERAVRDAADRARAEAADIQKRKDAAPRPVSAAEQRFLKVAPQLRQPWLPTLRLVEVTSEAPVYLQSLALDPTAGDLRIDGEAPDFASALNYVKSLSEPGLVESPQLLLHEQIRDGVVKFSARANWILR